MANKKFDLMGKLRNLGRLTLFQIVLLGVGAAAGILLFAFLQGFVSCWQLTELAGKPPSSCPAPVVINPEGTPVAGPTATPTLPPPDAELPPPWDGASRVTILVVGLDFGDWAGRTEAPRSDTMILLTLDPATNTAGMLSIPRDLWVNIPGFGYNRINTAYYFGELYDLPGGGPALAVKTVESFLGIQVDYYAQIEFLAFEQMVDTIGPICLEVPYEIRVGRTFENSQLLEPGYQCLDGKATLGYARARNTENGDVDRAHRTQQVILAIRDQVLANLPSVMARAPSLYTQLSSGINTNLTLPDALSLAMTARNVPIESIQQGVIDFTMMQPITVMINGARADVEKPYPDKIRELVDRVFAGGTMVPGATGDATSLMQQEQARIVIVNGAGVAGLASDTNDYLLAQGMNVVGFGNSTDYPDRYIGPFPGRTILIVHSGKPYAMKYLQALMAFDSSSQIVFDFDPEAPADIVVGLGSDWGYDNPMP
jgi:LCP family protein required for cell wall assembly